MAGPNQETVMAIIVKLNCLKIWPNVVNNHTLMYHRIDLLAVSIKHNYTKLILQIVVGSNLTKLIQMILKIIFFLIIQF